MLALCAATAAAQEDPYSRAENLAYSKRFAEAEREYRARLAEHPREWRLRLGLARVQLWSGRYAEADRAFRDLLAERPADGDALLGFAQAAYWAGDLRGAQRRYRDLALRDPNHEEAKRALADLATLSRPQYEVRAIGSDDSQPYGTFRNEIRASFFSDPVTRWDVIALGGSVDGGEAAIRAFGGGVSTTLPFRIGLAADLQSFRFPNGETKMLGSASAGTPTPWRGSFRIGVERAALLTTAAGVDDAATATRTFLSWQRNQSLALNVYRVDYSDDNRGAGVDGWFLAPVGGAFRAGVSAAWRDTDETRFFFTGFHSEPVTGGYRYVYTGEYDPYWTPLDLFEARAIVAWQWRWLKLQADGGWAEERATSFGPDSGPAQTPGFTFPIEYERTFHPWRASAEVTVPISGRVELRARYRHEVTSFYRSNEFEASVGGRL